MSTNTKKKEIAAKMYKQGGSKDGKGAPSGLDEYRKKKGRKSLNSVGKHMDNLVQEGKDEEEKA